MREKGYVLLAVMVFISIISLSLLAVLTNLFNDKLILKNEMMRAKSDAMVFKNIKNLEENRGILGGCTVLMRSPRFFQSASDAWWQENACLVQAGVFAVLAQGEVDAHRYVLVGERPMRAMQAAVILNVGGVVWFAKWLVASDEAAVIDSESVLSVAHREQLECLQS